MAKLKNNQTDNIDFLNPYTFVPFQKVPPKPEAWEQKYSSPEDLLTGWLDIELIPKTPIIIPDTAHREEIKVKNKKGADTVHNKYPFLRLPDTDGVPGIPGGSLRGMLRSVYETLTGSCVSSLMDERPISQRNGVSFTMIWLQIHGPFTVRLFTGKNVGNGKLNAENIKDFVQEKRCILHMTSTDC